MHKFIFMTRLSVNVNKIATLRNSRGGTLPNLWIDVPLLDHSSCKSSLRWPAKRKHSIMSEK